MSVQDIFFEQIRGADRRLGVPDQPQSSIHPPVHYGITEILIDGEWLPAEGARGCELIDPASRKLLATIQCASPEQRQRALNGTRAALEGWSKRAPETRAEAVCTITDEIWQAAGALAERQAIESGQPLRECQDLLANATRRLRHPSQHERTMPEARARRLPRYGLWPFWEKALHLIEAGSTLVCELPADRAWTALALTHCAQHLPAGVLNVITTEPEADTLPQADFPNDFVFVGQDAGLDVAVAGAAALRLYNTGQRVRQSARIHVEPSLVYAFADRLHEYLAFLEAGEPRQPITDLGPLHAHWTLQRSIEQIGDALKRGALVKMGGRQYQPWGLTGYFLQPTVLVEGVGGERAPHESISGPVVIVSPTPDIGKAVRESAGASRAPLRLAAFTAQRQRVEQSLRAVRLESRASAYTPQVDRAWKGRDCPESTAGTIDVEWIEEKQLDWFPYRNRRGLKL